VLACCMFAARCLLIRPDKLPRIADRLLLTGMFICLQDTGGFFVAVLQKVAETPDLPDPSLAHR
jgi:hypothetical protein